MSVRRLARDEIGNRGVAIYESKLRSILLQEGRIGRIAAARLLLELDGEGKEQ